MCDPDKHGWISPAAGFVKYVIDEHYETDGMPRLIQKKEKLLERVNKMLPKVHEHSIVHNRAECLCFAASFLAILWIN